MLGRARDPDLRAGAKSAKDTLARRRLFGGIGDDNGPAEAATPLPRSIPPCHRRPSVKGGPSAWAKPRRDIGRWRGTGEHRGAGSLTKKKRGNPAHYLSKAEFPSNKPRPVRLGRVRKNPKEAENEDPSQTPPDRFETNDLLPKLAEGAPVGCNRPGNFHRG